MAESEFVVVYHLHDDKVVRALARISSRVEVTPTDIQMEVASVTGAKSLVARVKFDLEGFTEGQRAALANSIAYPIKPNGTVDMKRQIRLPNYTG